MSNGAIFFPERPELRMLGGGQWQLCHDYIVPIELAKIRGSLDIPAGFITDLASVPRPIRLLIDRTELGGAAPIAHDYLYQHGGCYTFDHCLRRRQVDRLFLVLMRKEGVRRWKRLMGWSAVRLAGWACWHKCGKVRNALDS